MTGKRIGTREEWIAARAALLEQEKELTRMGGELARQRRELPWVPVEKQYTLETAAVTATCPISPPRAKTSTPTTSVSPATAAQATPDPVPRHADGRPRKGRISTSPAMGIVEVRPRSEMGWRRARFR